MSAYFIPFVWLEVCVSGYIYARGVWTQVLWIVYGITAAVMLPIVRGVTTWVERHSRQAL